MCLLFLIGNKYVSLKEDSKHFMIQFSIVSISIYVFPIYYKLHKRNMIRTSTIVDNEDVPSHAKN